MISREKIIVEHKIREQIRKIIFLSERDMLNSKINTLKEELDLRGTLRFSTETIIQGSHNTCYKKHFSTDQC